MYKAKIKIQIILALRDKLKDQITPEIFLSTSGSTQSHLKLAVYGSNFLSSNGNYKSVLLIQGLILLN